MKNIVTIVALSVDSNNATLFLKDGSTITIKQGDSRLPRIVAASKEKLKLHLPVEVDLTVDFPKRQEFADAEKGTNGVVRFFRVAKSLLKKLVDTESPAELPVEAAHVSPLAIGAFPGANKAPTTTKAPDAESNAAKLSKAKERLDVIMGCGASTDKPEFHTPLKDDETIVAVHTEKGTIVPEAQNLARHLRASSRLKDYTGFTKFMERLSLIIDERGHSVEDLMKFIEQGDLPIADDGCIVIYKRLRQTDVPDTFVDCYSGKVKQKVGSFVFMRAGLVDPNRRQDCSNGLHVASLSYLNSFGGDVTIIGKVRPEDVFAVPEGNTNKMRVSAYHIIAKLPEDLRKLVNRGGSISSTTEGAKLLNEVLSGKHIGITEYTEIGGQNGNNLKITAVKEINEAAPVNEDVVGNKTTLDMRESLEPIIPVADPVKLTDVVEMKTTKRKTVQKAKVAKKSSRADELYSIAVTTGVAEDADQAAQELLRMKAGAKKSWAALGFTNEEVTKVMGALSKQSNPKAEAMLAAQEKAEKRKQSGRAKSDSPASLIREFLDQRPLAKAQYEVILLLKRKAKKSWTALGVSPADQADIEQHTK